MRIQIKNYINKIIFTFLLFAIGLNIGSLVAKTNISEKYVKSKAIKFNQLLNRIIKSNPDILTYKLEIKTKDGLIEQSSLLPNPELELELENFAGSSELKGFKQSEFTINVAQPIILGGKRGKKINSAKLDKEISLRKFSNKLVELEFEAKKRYVKILFIQKKLELREKMIILAEKFAEKIKKRIEVGKTSPAELLRANVSILKNKLILKQFQKELSAAKLHLASLWGSNTVDFKNVLGDMERITFFPKIETYKIKLNQNTNLLILTTEIDHKKSILQLEKSLNIPDLTLNGGIRRLNDIRATAFSFNLSIPIPIKKPNQGNIKSAQYKLKKSESKYRALRLKVSNRLKVLFENLEIAYNNATTLKISILPKSSKMLKIISKGYELGKFEYLSVIDALKTQLEMKEEYFEALSNYWEIIAKIEKLICIHYEESIFKNIN